MPEVFIIAGIPIQNSVPKYMNHHIGEDTGHKIAVRKHPYVCAHACDSLTPVSRSAPPRSLSPSRRMHKRIRWLKGRKLMG